MAGIVVKSHHGSTVELASILNTRFKGLTVLGGITLNRFVGGLNPYAVEAAIALGGRLVWLPTLHAVHHGETCGGLGGFGFQKGAVKRVPSEGLSILEDGRLRSGVCEIMEVIQGAGQRVVLATGHISSKEVAALVEHRDRSGYDFPILVNHVLFHTPSMTVEQIAQLSRDNVWFETVQLCISDLVQATDAHTVAHTIQSTPRARWVLATDSGQSANLPCPEALHFYAEALRKVGLSEEKLESMLRDEPRALLGL